MNFDRDQLEAAFKKHADDRGKTDTLNLIEFGEMFIGLVGHDKGYTVDDIQLMFKDIHGGDDEVTFEEFWTAITAKPVTTDQLEDTFKQYDMDGSGVLTKDEVRKAFDSMPNKPSDEAINNVMDQVDTNDDGKVSIEEFKALWQ